MRRLQPSPETPPFRLVTRLLAEMQTNVVRAGLAAFAGNLDRFVIYTLIVRQTAPDSAILGEGPHPRGSAISASSLAASLSRPFETVRRHVNALIDEGLCARAFKGVIALPEGLARPEIAAALATTHDSFVRLAEDMKRFDLPMPAPRGPQPYNPAVGLRAAADLMLTVADSNARAHHEWINLVLFSVILSANSRGITYNPLLARAHADHTHPVPSALKTPVRVQAISRTMHLPYSTVQRRIQQLIEAGSVQRVRGGMLVSEDWLNAPPAVAVSINTYHNVLRVLGSAAAAGFPFADPARAYIRGRPEPVAFENAVSHSVDAG